MYRSAPLAQSIGEGAALARDTGKPVLLLDHGDDCMSGGTCDTTDAFEEALKQGPAGIVVGPLCDPEAVAALFEASESATVTVGNKLTSVASLGKPPLEVTGIVRALTDGEFVISGPTYTGQRAYMGRAAVIETPAARILVTERTHEPWDLGVFESVGIDSRGARFLILKSRLYCRPVFVPISGGLVECDSRGATSSDYGLFTFENLKRPVYPLDSNAEY